VSQVAVYRDGVPLSRRRIITAAMELIEAEGSQAVSMTRLATELGCGLVPLYSHVPSTSALLDGITATIMSGVDARLSAGAGWADELRAQARAFRQAARAYPRCSVAVAGREPATAPLHRPTEEALAALRTAGFCGQDAIRIVRALAAYLTGTLIREVGSSRGIPFGSSPGSPPGGAPAPGTGFDADDDRRPRLRPAEFPQITGLAAELALADPDADFELGLELLVLGMDALLSVRQGG
jgi:AcrR family transcriptional regulator